MTEAKTKLLIEFNERRVAVLLSSVERVLEEERLASIPGQRGFVCGVVGLYGEPVAVADLKQVLGLDRTAAHQKKIIVLKDRERCIGLDIGDAKIRLLWEDGLEGQNIELLDWQRLFDDTASILCPEGAAKRILIADDSDFMRARLRNILSDAGFNIVGEAENGKDTLAKTALLKPDILILDLAMPVMDGLAVLAELERTGHSTRIVVCS
ncbi:MAG: response regulator, partial [Deltaproteobacteria bacterium]|nr:response regulator [Deltaproteobacteria bacterium]